jgi:enoyl-CoA hydratase/carnithine racemase
MLALMAEERWLTPAEAKALGFVQEIDDPFDAAEVAAVRAIAQLAREEQSEVVATAKAAADWSEARLHALQTAHQRRAA